MRRTSCQNFRKENRDRGRTAADKKAEISHEKARTHTGVFGLKSTYISIQLN